METIGIVVIVMAAIASLTKIIDVVTTILRVDVHTEINPIGRVLFRRLGVKGGCWATFVLWTVACMGVAWPFATCGDIVDCVCAIIIYSVLTYLNISTGLFNMRGIAIPFTRTFIKFYGWLGRKLGVR